MSIDLLAGVLLRDRTSIIEATNHLKLSVPFDMSIDLAMQKRKGAAHPSAKFLRRTHKLLPDVRGEDEANDKG